MRCEICGEKTFSIFIDRRYGRICFEGHKMVNTMFIPDGFELYELFPKNFYLEHYRPANIPKMWNVFDYRLKYTMDRLRKRYGPLVANDWYWGGVNQYRGWRPTDCIVGADFSQHKYGRAIDLKTTKKTDGTVFTIRDDINHEDFKYITCVEMNITWLHIDVRDYNKEKFGILKVYP